ncbi:MAG: TetR/AcrR family transcriptional regulator [Chloroflexi bacterium]|nr:TetR/AcrR family transcriptional regulator [Chloroflexota bacterium]
MKQDNNQNANVDVKESIIDATTELIRESNGNLNQVTIRNIALRADVSIGLINYHFMSKQQLIEVCVERIIRQVIRSFKFNQGINEPKDRLLSGAISVFAFLEENPEIAKVSILSDLSSPQTNTNSVTSYKGILNALPDSFSEEKKKVVAFMLLSTIQSAFLNRTIANDLLDFDLYSDEGVYTFFKYAIDLLFTPDSIHD